MDHQRNSSPSACAGPATDDRTEWSVEPHDFGKSAEFDDQMETAAVRAF